mgnify:CR=1 FL=1
MLKIGEFSKLSHITIKALRFYEKEKLLIPTYVDKYTGYRFYESSQLEFAAKIKSFRQLGLSINEIKRIFNGEDVKEILLKKEEDLKKLQNKTELQISIIEFILEEKEMKYQVTIKEIPKMIIYYSETILNKYEDIMQWIPSVGEECKKLNPSIKCTDPPYEFCEYLDGEYREANIKIRHNEAVTSFGNENKHIKFKTLPSAKVLSIYHNGSYDTIADAYAFIIEYAEKNGYEIAGPARESYIDGIWNKESVNDWLTEIQLPIK